MKLNTRTKINLRLVSLLLPLFAAHLASGNGLTPSFAITNRSPAYVGLQSPGLYDRQLALVRNGRTQEPIRCPGGMKPAIFAPSTNQLTTAASQIFNIRREFHEVRVESAMGQALSKLGEVCFSNTLHASTGRRVLQMAPALNSSGGKAAPSTAQRAPAIAAPGFGPSRGLYIPPRNANAQPPTLHYNSRGRGAWVSAMR